MREERNRFFSWTLSVTFRVIAIIGGISLLLSYVSIYANPVRVPFLPFFGLYFIPILLINFVILIAGLLKRSKATWITIAALLPSLLYINLFFRFGRGQQESNSGHISIMSYNVGLFAQQQEKGEGITFSEVSTFANRLSPDIVCFQEFLIKDTTWIPFYFPAYPYHVHHFYKSSKKGFFGNLTLSKYPIVGRGKITFKGSTNHCIYTDITIGEEKIRVYNTHLESHSISFTALIKRISNSNNFSEEILGVHDKVANTFKKRAYQVNAIANHSEMSSLPSIICGDFNDTPMSYTYNILSKNRKDSFKKAGNGFGATYSVLWPMLRIDYILVPSKYKVVSHRTLKNGYSDHYPIIAEMTIESNRNE